MKYKSLPFCFIVISIALWSCLFSRQTKAELVAHHSSTSQPPQSQEPAPIPGMQLYPQKGDNGLYGYMDEKGIWKIRPLFQAANPFLPDGTAWVMQRWEHERINQLGATIFRMDPNFLYLHPFSSNGMAMAESYDRLWGFVDENGNWLVTPKFKRLESFADNGLAL
ncbi:MAG: WG repeat-containing protein, partial [Deltaproteobacteria bacterium]|nr:WG repeat-containing protein [Deltaproteobacteria bacterium]